MRTVSFILVAAISISATARAQAPDVGHSCAANCGGDSSSSSSGDSAANAAAAAAEQRERDRIDRENKERAREERHIHDVRSENEDGVGAARAKHWNIAIKHFQEALKLDPNNTLASANLSEAQRQQAAEAAVRADEQAARERYEALEAYKHALAAEQRKMAKVMAAGMPVPPPGSGPTLTAPSRIDSSMPAAWPDGDAMVRRGIDFVGDRVKDEALGQVDGMIDVMTPQGYFVRLKRNEARMWREEVPKMLSGAVSGDISPNDPLTLKFVTMLFNVGSGPGDMLQKIVEVGDAGKVVYDEAKWRVQNAANKGIESIVIGTGAALTAAPETFKADAHALLREIKDGKAVVDNWTKVIVGDKK